MFIMDYIVFDQELFYKNCMQNKYFLYLLFLT
jgi:hypothetical protein